VITEFAIESPNHAESNMERFTPEMLAMLNGNYRRMRVVNPYYIYIPAR
jgi:hypothetical protein